jgi:uncharacterized protein YdhG (YjbR/CyaY superfamily)
MPKPSTIDDYIDQSPDAGRRQLQDLRALCRKGAPEAVEQIKWGHPAYVHPDGVILFMFSGHTAHASFAVTPTTREAFADELGSFRTGKGTVALPYDSALPQNLLHRMIKFRVHEYEDHGIKWM